MNAPEMVKLMREQAGDVSTSTPGEFAAMLKSDFARWTSVIKANGIHVD
jgi:tripartite-type tricarboxylate transporter receptor subunit TctC